MKKFINTLTLAFILISNTYAVSDCEVNLADPYGTIEKLSDEVLEATSKAPGSDDVLDVTVTYLKTNQGKGKVYVITDDNGDIAGVRVDFKVNGKSNESMIRTFDQLNSSNEKLNKLEYRENPNSKPALVVKKATGATIYKQTGGKFLFQILTQKSPPIYQDYEVYLRKVGSDWIVKGNDGLQKKSVDLSPDVDINIFSSSEWKGTFSRATFQ